MWKFIKRTLQIITALVIVGIFALVGYENSSRLAMDMAFLSCPVKNAQRLDNPDQNFLATIKSRAREQNPYVRLQRDWIRGEVILHWIADISQSENGLQGAKRLQSFVNEYSGYDWIDRADRSINRETLVYRLEVKDKYWVERKCATISKQKFYDAVQAVANATKAKQKI